MKFCTLIFNHNFDIKLTKYLLISNQKLILLTSEYNCNFKLSGKEISKT